MVSQRAISFEADLDISDVMRGLNRIERQARSVGGTVGRVGGGLGRAGGSVGRTVGAGAGIGAGAAVFEMLIQRIFELFEGTPVLETFTMALDTLFQAFGPVIGVLLESLTPVIVALTPAIEPLARALTPLIQLLGTQLLVAVELVTPGIVLVAEGLARVTAVIQRVVLQGIQFVVDQLNKLPFVDIQANLDVTGGSFDAMALQIQNAGDDAETGGGKVDALGNSVATMGDMAETAATRANTAASSQAIMNETQATAAARIESYAKQLEIQRDASERSAESTALWTRVAEENKAAADAIITPLTLVNDEMDEMYTASTSLGTAIATAAQPTSELDERIAEMTERIEEATAETELQAAALEALSPELRTAAEELGLFGLRVEEVADMASNAAATLNNAARSFSGSSSSSRRRASGGTQTSTVTVDANGNLIYSESFGGDAGGPAAMSSQRLFTDDAGNVFTDARLRNPASDEAQRAADMIMVNVMIDGEAVATATTRAASEGA